MFALAPRAAVARDAADAMTDAFARHGLASTAHVTRLSSQGARRA